MTNTKERGRRVPNVRTFVDTRTAGASSSSTGRADARRTRGRARGAVIRASSRVESSRVRPSTVGRAVGRSDRSRLDATTTRCDSTARDSDGDAREGQSRASIRTTPSRTVARYGLPERLDRLDRSTRARASSSRAATRCARCARAHTRRCSSGWCGVSPRTAHPSFSGFRVEGRASRVGAPLERATRRSCVNRARRSVDS